MRYLFRISLILFFLSNAVQAADSLEIAGHLAQSSAPQLALVRVERDQPERARTEQWVKWELLRLSLLNQLNRPDEVLQRVAALPAEMPDEIQHQTWWQGARAAIKLGRAAQAREFLLRLLWQSDLTEPQYREARRLVAQSYLPGKTGMAYRAMLRYGQDFQPISAADAAIFTEAMLAAGAREEAGTWLTALEESSALQLRARLASGLVTPAQAIAESRNALNPLPVSAAKADKIPAKNSADDQPNPSVGVIARPIDPAGYWAVILQAAIMQQDMGLQVEAREKLLNEAGAADGAADLWPSYFDLALQEGNRAHLLQGEDRAWFGLGQQMAEASPLSARSLFAYLAVHGGNSGIREAAQENLVAQLVSARLHAAAARLFADGEYFQDGVLTPRVRYELGKAAAQAGLYKHAARFWRGLDQPPEDMPQQQWVFNRTQVLVGGGAYQEAAEVARQLPLPETPEQRVLMMALAELADSKGESLPAAGYYLQVAGQAEDSLAQKARYFAAQNLERAGLKQDAGKQYLILQKLNSDIDQQAPIRRALGRL